jgi:hypothetical protein
MRGLKAMDPLDSPSRIEACIINHDTSPFAELALRSFSQMHGKSPAHLNVSLTIVDNHSQDDAFADLKDAATEVGVPIVRSRWPAREARCNTHGDVLRDFVLDRREADMFLFIDADVIFDEPGTVWTMAEEAAIGGAPLGRAGSRPLARDQPRCGGKPQHLARAAGRPVGRHW